MAIRFVEREPGRGAAVETDAATEPLAGNEVPPPVAAKHPKRRRTVPEPVADAALQDPGEHASPDRPSNAPDALVDGVLPGLAPPARPPKRRRSRMMGFG